MGLGGVADARDVFGVSDVGNRASSRWTVKKATSSEANATRIEQERSFYLPKL